MHLASEGARPGIWGPHADWLKVGLGLGLQESMVLRVFTGVSVSTEQGSQ